jgi:cytochrome c556
VTSHLSPSLADRWSSVREASALRCVTLTSRVAALLIFTTSSLVVATLAGASETAGPAAPGAVIEARQQGFKKMGAAMKALNEQLKTGAPDPAKAIAATEAISAGARAQSEWFPAGSGPESGAETDALAHIWKDRAKFDSLTARLVSESKALAAAAAANDAAALKTQAKVVADTCSTCHRSFRAD